MNPSFVHLHVHSEYSLVDGIVRIKPLVARAVEMGMPAVAVTDQSNLFALVKFYQAAQAVGVKPIVGVDAWLRNLEDVNNPFRLVLLVQNNIGYKNLTRLVSRSYREGQHLGRPMLEREWLTDNVDGLIALSGGRQGDLGRALLAGNQAEAERLLVGWLALFGDRFYLELNRTGRPEEEACLHACVELAAAQQTPVVATNDVHFISPDDFEAHEVRGCIHEGRTLDDPRRPRSYSEQQYLRTPEEMQELFADIPEALENTVEIARRCSIELTLGKNYLPDFPIPEGMTIEEYFAAESRKGLEWRLERILDRHSPEFAEQRKVYDERLQIELNVINGMGFPGYFLIVADFIQWAKDNDIPVGPGRGSGAGSLVAYALKITDLDPIDLELLFERFLNPERVSMPDFDVDFCMEKRDLVIDYVARTYGRDSVSQIITYGTMAAKAVVRDVGRVLGHPYGFTDRVAKMIPFEIGMTLNKALEESEDLKQAYETDEEVRDLIEMAKKLEGCARNAGKHAGGVVIAPGLLTDFSPLYCEEGGGNLVTQFDKDDVEKVGLVKFDFLGLRTLTIIDWALKTVNAGRAKQGLEPVDINAIPMDDEAAFKLLKRCETTAVFQLESRGMKELIKKLQPDSFDDITALVALYRPGPLQSGMVDNFINRKHGREAISYPDVHYQHESLKPILEPTYGVILYQEQVMQIAQVLSGYSLGGADMLRRAMGKKKPEEMAKQRAVFKEGAEKNNIDPGLAMKIFDLVEKFAGYGFNKSHSAAYALVSYQTMWLKTHYPAAFMAAVCSADMDNTDKVVPLIEECRRMGLKVEAPQVNLSQYKFTIADERTVIYGLGAIKGVGEAAIEAIVSEREANSDVQGGTSVPHRDVQMPRGEDAQERPAGAGRDRSIRSSAFSPSLGGRRAGATLFTDLFEFCRRIDMKKINRRVLESLIRAGALDGMGANRATLMIQLPLALKMAEQHHEMQAVGQNDLFGMSDPQPMETSQSQVVPNDVEDWEDEQRLQGEKETLGLYLTGHPIDRYEDELRQIAGSRIADLSLDSSPGSNGHRRRGVPVVVAGLVVSTSHRQTQRGRMGTIVLDDRSGRIEATLFSETYEAHRDLLAVDKILVVSGSLNYDEFRGGLSIRVDNILTFEQARGHYAGQLGLNVKLNGANACGFRHELLQILSPFKGGTTGIRLHYQTAEVEGDMLFGKEWTVNPTDELLRRLGRLLGSDNVRVIYGRGGAG